MSVGSSLVARHLDEPTTPRCEQSLRGLDECPTNTLTARTFGDDEHREPSDWRRPVQHRRDVNRHQSEQHTFPCGDQHNLRCATHDVEPRRNRVNRRREAEFPEKRRKGGRVGRTGVMNLC